MAALHFIVDGSNEQHCFGSPTLAVPASYWKHSGPTIDMRLSDGSFAAAPLTAPFAEVLAEGSGIKGDGSADSPICIRVVSAGSSIAAAAAAAAAATGASGTVEYSPNTYINDISSLTTFDQYDGGATRSHVMWELEQWHKTNPKPTPKPVPDPNAAYNSGQKDTRFLGSTVEEPLLVFQCHSST